MSVQTHLRVHEVHASFDTPDPHGLPEQPVVVGRDGTRVVLVADPRHAELLARIIARVTAAPADGDDIQPDLWHHVVVDLLAAKALAAGLPARDAVVPVGVLS